MPLTVKEDEILIAYMDFVANKRIQDARYQYIFHVPNEGKRSWFQGKRMKRKGLSKGVLDILCPYPIEPWRGFVIELKSEKGKVTAEQSVWLDRFTNVGWACIIANTLEKAIGFTEFYMSGRVTIKRG